MGLTPDQLLLLEEYAEELKGGRCQEEKLAAQLQKRVGHRRRGIGFATVLVSRA